MNELSKVADGVDGGQMKRVIPITTLFVDSFISSAPDWNNEMKSVAI
jgi:hypothetical protein